MSEGVTVRLRMASTTRPTEPLLVEWGAREPSDAKVYAALAQRRTIFYTPPVCCHFRELRSDIVQFTVRLHACVSEHLCGKPDIGTDLALSLIHI